MTHDAMPDSVTSTLKVGRYAPPGADRGGHAANVHGAERIASGVAGAALLWQGLRRGGLPGVLQVLLGGALLARSATGHCLVKRSLAATPYERRYAQEHGWHSATAVSASVVIQRPRPEVYAYWRNFNNLSHFMGHIERIEMLSSKRSRWVVKAPLGQTVEWVAHVTEDIPDERIAWETEYDADVRSSGWVEFRDTPDNAGTQVQALIAYEPPGGRVGHLAARLWREDPATQAGDDLNRLKVLLETARPTA